MRFLYFAIAVLVGLGIATSAVNRPASANEEALLSLLADRTGDIPDPPPGKAALRLSVTYLPVPLPGAGIEFYEPSPEASQVWTMQSLGEEQPVPVGRLIEDGVVFLSPGEARLVTVVYRNPTTSDVGFVVLPHRESPFGQAPNVWLTCLCMSHVYEAPAQGAWYRVIRVKVSPTMPPGAKVDALYTVLTDPAVFPERDGDMHRAGQESDRGSASE